MMPKLLVQLYKMVDRYLKIIKWIYYRLYDIGHWAHIKLTLVDIYFKRRRQLKALEGLVVTEEMARTMDMNVLRDVITKMRNAG